MMRAVRTASLQMVGVSLAASVAFAAAQPQARYHEKVAGTLVSFEMVRVPAGANIAEFYIGQTEVTWDLYDVYALGLDRQQTGGAGAADAVARPSEPYGAPDRGWGHAGFPAMSVTREAAENFCKWLSARTGKAYRLPTEAEWARAASLAAGPQPLTAARLESLAWFEKNSDARSHPVGRRAADALGLADLFGNVAEWVTTASGARVVAGGSYRDDMKGIGPAARATQDPTWNQTDPQLPKSRWWLSDGPFAGFRLAVTLTGVRP